MTEKLLIIQLGFSLILDGLIVIFTLGKKHPSFSLPSARRLAKHRFDT